MIHAWEGSLKRAPEQGHVLRSECGMPQCGHGGGRRGAALRARQEPLSQLEESAVLPRSHGAAASR